MRLADIMETSVETTTPETSAEQAYTRMRLHGCHHLVVVRDGAVLGVLSDRDLGSRRGAAVRAGQTVGELMASPVASATPSTTTRKAANLMRGRSIGCLPVMDGRRLVGIVTVSDLLDALGGHVERPTATAKRWVMKGRGPRQKAQGARSQGRA